MNYPVRVGAYQNRTRVAWRLFSVEVFSYCQLKGGPSQHPSCFWGIQWTKLAKIRKLVQMLFHFVWANCRWAVGNKNLTINQVVQIMCDMRLHGDWERALTKNIPKRKLFQPEDFNPDLNDGQPYHKRQSAQQRLQTRRGRDRSVFQMMMDDV